jgi:hypothetical protein
MPDYDRRHVLAQWGGTLPGGEIWSNSVRLAGSGEGADATVPIHDDMVAWLNGPAKDAVAAFHSAADTLVHSAAKLTFLKLNVIQINGRYLEPNTLEYVYPTPVAGGAAAVLHPNQVALVVSLTTGISRGPAHRGRFYLPLPAIPVQTDGLIMASSANQVATSAATFIKALADQPGLDAGLTDMRAVVMSKRAGTPDTHEITGVAVGRALDTQRRRRVELVENYVEVPVAQ